MPRHVHRAEGTFGSAFGGSADCIFGAVAALSAIFVGCILLCAGLMGGCGMFVKKTVEQVEENRVTRETVSKEKAKAEPRYDMGKWASVGHCAAMVEGASVFKNEGRNYLMIDLVLGVNDDKKAWDFKLFYPRDRLMTDPDGNVHGVVDIRELLRMKDAPSRVYATGRIVSGTALRTAMLFQMPPPGVQEVWLDLPVLEEPNGYLRLRVPRSAWADPVKK
jgi:hypothetical protein